MSRVGLALLRAYLELFAYFAPDRTHVRREHSLIEASVREAYGEHRARYGPVGAALRTARGHVGEFWPPALIAKTRADCAAVRPDRRYLLRLASGVGGLAILGVAAFLTLGIQSGPTGPVTTIGRPFAEGDPNAGGTPVTVATASSLQEGIYIASGGTVCIDPRLTGADLTDEIVNGESTPEELEACAHYELPQ